MSWMEKAPEWTYTGSGDMDHTLDNNHERLLPWDSKNDKLLETPPSSGLGALDVLPLELLHMVLLLVHIRALRNFRGVNRRAMQLVDDIPQYKKIITHAPVALQATLSIRTGFFFSCQDLYAMLCTEKCGTCGDFGGFLYLITCQRVCYLCFTHEREYLPIIYSEGRRNFGLNRHSDFAGIPSMTSVPGVYTPRKLSRLTPPYTMYDYPSARKLAIAVHGSISAMEQYVASARSAAIRNFNIKTASLKFGDPRPQRPILRDHPDERMGNPRRFMAIVHAPVLDKRGGPVEWGFHCRACFNGDLRGQLPTCPGPHVYGVVCSQCRKFRTERKFNAESFEAHIEECGRIEDGVHVVN